MSKPKEPTTPEYIGTAKYDPTGQIVWAVDKNDGLQMLANVRGWGRIQNMFRDHDKAASFQDEIGQFIADAINEKIEREKETISS